MSERKPLSEGPGLITGALDDLATHIGGKFAKRKADKQHAYDNSHEGKIRQSGLALHRWTEKIASDWAQYAHVHSLEATEANLKEFLKDTYRIDGSGFSPMRVGVPSSSSTPAAEPASQPAAQAPQEPQAAQTPASPAQQAQAPSPAPANANSPAPAAPAQPTEPVKPTLVAPAQPKPAPARQAPAAPTTPSKPTETPHQVLTRTEEIVRNPESTPEQKTAARREMSKALDALRNVKMTVRREGIEFGEDIIRDRPKHIDDLPSRIDNKDFKDASFLDTARELGLYDTPKKKIKPTKNATLHEDDLAEKPMSKVELQHYFLAVARYILKDPSVMAASKKYDIGTPDYSQMLRAMKANSGSSSSYRSSDYSQSSGAANHQPDQQRGASVSFEKTPYGKTVIAKLSSMGYGKTFANAIEAARQDPKQIDAIVDKFGIKDLRAFLTAMMLANTTN